MQLPIEDKRNIFERLVAVCANMKDAYNENGFVHDDIAKNIATELNALLAGYDMKCECVNAFVTNNKDNVTFGINVSPTLTDQDTLKILLDDASPIELTRYSLEIDSKLLEILNDIEPIELAGYIVEEVVSTMDIRTIDHIRYIIALVLTEDDTAIEIKQSINYTQLLSFAIKNTIRNYASLLYKEEERVGYNIVSESLNLKELLLVTREKVKSCLFEEMGDETAPNLGVLRWVLMVYKDPISFYRRAEETLNNAKAYTGSVLDKKEIERTLVCLQRAATEVVAEAAVLEESFKGFSLFKNLKQNGLRAIEDDLYEFKIRLKNCEVEDEALYIVRQINTRISILEDYLRNTDVSESEYERWNSLILAYRELRAEVAKKKIGNKKTYGVFVDYDKLDQLDY